MNSDIYFYDIKNLKSHDVRKPIHKNKYQCLNNFKKNVSQTR